MTNLITGDLLELIMTEAEPGNRLDVKFPIARGLLGPTLPKNPKSPDFS